MRTPHVLLLLLADKLKTKTGDMNFQVGISSSIAYKELIKKYSLLKEECAD